MPGLHGPANLAYNVCVPETLLRTKLYIPPLRPNQVARHGLVERLNQGLQLGHKLTLISAPAGFGKTTLVAEWLNQEDEGGRTKVEESESQRSSRIGGPLDYVQGGSLGVAWLSLDEGDNDPARFLTYLVAALQTLILSDGEGNPVEIGQAAMALLQSPQPPPAESVLTAVLNEISDLTESFILVLDDYHLIEPQTADAPVPVDDALNFLLDHQPRQMHLVIATRVDPNLPLARLRARGQLNELRAIDLRFTQDEAAEFLNRAMGLNLSAGNVADLEARTEGWIAGLQLAALALQGQDTSPGDKDTAERIESFTGGHRFVLDYLLAEVLAHQPQDVQTFLIQTAVLERLSGSLCDALTGLDNGQQTLEYLDQANLFIVPLDGERRWYRYHHLFADLLRRRLRQSEVSPADEGLLNVAQLHRRASEWFEENGLEIEAFQHAAAANDVERAARLIEGDGLPLAFRGAVGPVLKWLASLPKEELDARPSLWVAYAMATLVTGEINDVEEKLLAAEAALDGAELNDQSRDLIGRIADMRGNMAVGRWEVDTILSQSRRALEYLQPDNLAYRTSTTWQLGVAYEFQGDRVAASQAYDEAIAISRKSGNIYVRILATTGLGNIELAENQLHAAAETYKNVMVMVGDLPIPVACHVYLCQARIAYEWNKLAEAEALGQQSLQLARQYVSFNDYLVVCQLFLSRLKLAQGDLAGASDMLEEAHQVIRQHNYVVREPELAAIQVLALLDQGNVVAAADVAEEHEQPMVKASVSLAMGDAAAALAQLEPLRQQMETRGWADELLKIKVLEAVAYYAHGEKDKAMQRLGEALAMGEPGGFVRTFVDVGRPMAALLTEMQESRAKQTLSGGGVTTAYIRTLLSALGKQDELRDYATSQPQSSALGPRSRQAVNPQPLVEPLSDRELEVLELIAEGLSNPEIAVRLYLSTNTVKVHARNIFGKLDVHSRTQALMRAQELGLLPRGSV